MVRASLSQKELSGSHLNVSQAFLFGGENLLQNTGAQSIVLQCFCAFYITFAIKVSFFTVCFCICRVVQARRVKPAMASDGAVFHITAQ